VINSKLNKNEYNIDERFCDSFLIVVLFFLNNIIIYSIFEKRKKRRTLIGFFSMITLLRIFCFDCHFYKEIVENKTVCIEVVMHKSFIKSTIGR